MTGSAKSGAGFPTIALWEDAIRGSTANPAKTAIPRTNAMVLMERRSEE
jgi:hypothetical protein